MSEFQIFRNGSLREPPEAVGPVQSMWMCAVPAEATRECDLSAQSCTVTIVTVQTHQFVILIQGI